MFKRACGSADEIHVTTALKLGIAAAIAVVVGVGLGFLTLTIIQDADRDPETATAALSAGAAAVERTRNAYAEAEGLRDITAAARTADAAGQAVERAVGSLSREMNDPIFRTQVVQALTAQQQLLGALAQPVSLTDRSLNKWPAMRDRARASLDAMAASWKTVSAAKELGELPTDPGRTISRTVTEIDEYLRKSRRLMSRWERKRRVAIRERKAERGVLDSYGSSLRSYLNQYTALRTDMSDWIVEVDSDGVTFQEAYDFLGDASSARTRILKGVEALDPPQTLASQHNTMLSVITDAIVAVDAAIDGTSDYQFDIDNEYASYRDAPGWRRFTADSETISKRYAAAQSAWETGFKQARKKIAAQGLPARPRI